MIFKFKTMINEYFIHNISVYFLHFFFQERICHVSHWTTDALIIICLRNPKILSPYNIILNKSIRSVVYCTILCSLYENYLILKYFCPSYYGLGRCLTIIQAMRCVLYYICIRFESILTRSVLNPSSSISWKNFRSQPTVTTDWTLLPISVYLANIGEKCRYPF